MNKATTKTKTRDARDDATLTKRRRGRQHRDVPDDTAYIVTSGIEGVGWVLSGGQLMKVMEGSRPGMTALSVYDVADMSESQLFDLVDELERNHRTRTGER
jgi:hypothetical protein